MKYYSNIADIELNRKNIAKHFDIFKVVNGNEILGKVSNDSFPTIADAIVYTYRAPAFLMFDKGSIKAKDLLDILSSYDPDNLELKVVPTDITDETSLSTRFLAQLMINYLPNRYSIPGYKCNNLTGRYIHFNPLWHSKGKQKIWGLDISLSKNLSFILRTRTFVIGNRNAKKIPYTVDDIHGIRKVNKNEKAELVYHIGHTEEKSNIDFLAYDKYTNFKSSKLGSLYSLINSINDHFSNYIHIKLKILDLRGDEVKTKHSFDERMPQLLSNKGINIIDLSHVEDAAQTMNRLSQLIERSYGVKPEISGNANSAKYNIIIAHSEDWYRFNNETDITHNFKKGVIAQHLTLENDKITDDKGKKIHPQLKTILKELIIKGDIINNTISLTDWESFGFSQTVTFAMAETKTEIFGDKEMKKIYYHTMKVSPSGKCTYETFTNLPNCSQEQIEITMAMAGKYNDVDTNIELICFTDSSKIFIIKKTDFRTMPDIFSIGDNLKNINLDDCIDYGIILEAAEEFDNKDILTKVNGVCYQKGDMVSKKTIKDIVNLRTSDGRKFCRWLANEKGIWLSLLIKSRDSDEIYQLSNMSGIRYFITPLRKDGTNPKSYSYYVAPVKELGEIQRLAKGCVIREISCSDGSLPSTETVERMIQLMEVEFVRLEQNTVLPFTAKYLRESFLIL